MTGTGGWSCCLGCLPSYESARLLCFCLSSLPMHPEKEQATAQGVGTLPPKWEMWMQFLGSLSVTHAGCRYSLTLRSRTPWTICRANKCNQTLKLQDQTTVRVSALSAVHSTGPWQCHTCKANTPMVSAADVATQSNTLCLRLTEKHLITEVFPESKHRVPWLDS